MVFRIETYKKGSLPSLEKKHGLNGNPPENAIAAPLLAPPRETLLESVLYRVAQRKNPEQSFRRDAVLLCEAILSGCDALLPQIEREELPRLFKSAAAYLQHRFLPENCMYAVMYTEPSPCMCFGFVPITEEGWLSASRVLAKSRIGAIQTELLAHLAQCGHNVEAQRKTPAVATPGNNTAIEALRESVRALERGKRELEQELQVLERQRELEAEVLALQRENQNLRLEKIMLSRQIEGYVEVLSANPELEQQFTTQLQLMKCMKSHTKKNVPVS